MIELVCKTCGKTFEVWPYRKDNAKYCSLNCRPQAFHKNHAPWNKGKPNPKCAGKNNYFFGKYFRGKDSLSWKGGKTIDNGYLLIKKPSHPFANSGGYVRKHRLVMEKILGRYLLPEERVHHMNGNKLDNRPINLKYFPNEAAHQRYHHFLRKHQSK